MAEKIERKLLAHYIDASFDTTGNTPKYVVWVRTSRSTTSN